MLTEEMEPVCKVCERVRAKVKMSREQYEVIVLALEFYAREGNYTFYPTEPADVYVDGRRIARDVLKVLREVEMSWKGL